MIPTTISRFRNGGDDKTADLLEKVVYHEEITHCAAGVKWFRYLCLRSRNPDAVNGFRMPQETEPPESDVAVEENDEVIQKFHATVRAYFRGPLKPPFNEAARRVAGFGPRWYEPLAVKDVPTE